MERVIVGNLDAMCKSAGVSLKTHYLGVAANNDLFAIDRKAIGERRRKNAAARKASLAVDRSDELIEVEVSAPVASESSVE